MKNKIKRTLKPRDNGITSLIDEGMPIDIIESYLKENHKLIDIVKFGQGTALVMPNLKKKIKLFKKYNIQPYFGGTLFEKFFYEKNMDNFFKLLEEFSIKHVEISNGTVDISLKDRVKLIQNIKKKYTILSEVGCKDSSHEMPVNVWIKEINELIKAGSKYIILEGRNSGTAGIYTKDGKIKKNIVEAILKKFHKNKFIFECPTSISQMYFINLIGKNVNLGNIDIKDIVLLECQRQNLRNETFFG